MSSKKRDLSHLKEWQFKKGHAPIKGVEKGWFKKGEHPSLKTEFKKGSMVRWKGEGAGYVAKHTWISKQLGKPHFCEECGNKKLNHRQYHWANKSGKYLRDLSDWIRLCVKCHLEFDKDNKHKYA